MSKSEKLLGSWCCAVEDVLLGNLNEAGFQGLRALESEVCVLRDITDFDK